MTIQINTDKTIEWHERHEEHYKLLIRDELERFADDITRVEVHLADQNGAKDGINDIRCLIEVRIEGRQPIATSDQEDTLELAVTGAITKMQASLKTLLERNHK